MLTKTSDEYISNRAWFQDALTEENVILRGVSALEYLQLFPGYAGEGRIDVYAKSKGKYDNINYYIVDNFDNIDFFLHGGIKCSGVSQAISDILLDEDMDEQALVEALSRYYYMHNESFEGLGIKVNLQKFNELKEWAVKFFGE